MAVLFSFYGYMLYENFRSRYTHATKHNVAVTRVRQSGGFSAMLILVPTGRLGDGGVCFLFHCALGAARRLQSGDSLLAVHVHRVLFVL